jgi:hypothetical protein
MQNAIIASVAAFVLGTCSRPSTIERQLIGTWEAPGVEVVYAANNDYSAPTWVMQITFTPDHHEFWRVPGIDRQARARWYLEGHDLVFTTESESDFGPPGSTLRETITKLTSDELVFSDGKVEGRWKRVR